MRIPEKTNIEFLTITVDDEMIDLIGALGTQQPVSNILNAHWKGFVKLNNQLQTELQKLCNDRLMLVCRCVPCNFIFETPISRQLVPDMFSNVQCERCGNKNVNVIQTKNYKHKVTEEIKR